MPDDNDYGGLSQEEIDAIMDDDEGPSDDASSLKEEPQSTENNDSTNDKEDENNHKDDKLNKFDDGQQVENNESGEDKVSDANESQKPDETPESDTGEKDEDDTKKTEIDVSKETDPKPDGATKEQKPFVSTFPEIDAAKLEGLKAKLDEAQKQFSDGDIDYAELDTAKDAYNELKWKAEFTETSNLNTRETLWKWEQDRFFDDNAKFRDNTTLNVALVAVVNGIIATEDGAKLTDRQVLSRAKEQVETDLGLIVKDSKDKAKTEEKKKQAALAGAKKANADTSNLAADIGGVPSAEENIDMSPFAYLDKLEGEKYQAAIDKLSPEQLRQYEDS